jgi:hypothetical protein
VAYPVEPLGFKFLLNHPQPPLLDGIRDRLGKEADLFDQQKDRQANVLQYVHNVVVMDSSMMHCLPQRRSWPIL